MADHAYRNTNGTSSEPGLRLQRSFLTMVLIQPISARVVFGVSACIYLASCVRSIKVTFYFFEWLYILFACTIGYRKSRSYPCANHNAKDRTMILQ